MNNFTTIFWDVDGTLLDFDYSERVSIKKCFESIGLDITEDMIKRYSEINLSYWKKFEQGLITKQELLVKRFLSFFDEYNISNVDVEAFRLEYQHNLSTVYRYLDNSFELVKAIKEKYKIKQYVVTNGVSKIQRTKLNLSGFDTLMDDLFISEEIGVPKPGKEFFEYCFAKISEKDKEKILIIGDSLSSDIKGGFDSNIKTCWYRKNTQVNNWDIEPDYEISVLSDVLKIL